MSELILKIKETLEVKTTAVELYEILSNFDYRLLWVKGIDDLEYEKNKVNRALQFLTICL